MPNKAIKYVPAFGFHRTPYSCAERRRLWRRYASKPSVNVALISIILLLSSIAANAEKIHSDIYGTWKIDSVQTRNFNKWNESDLEAFGEMQFHISDTNSVQMISGEFEALETEVVVMDHSGFSIRATSENYSVIQRFYFQGKYLFFHQVNEGTASVVNIQSNPRIYLRRIN